MMKTTQQVTVERLASDGYRFCATDGLWRKEIHFGSRAEILVRDSKGRLMWVDQRKAAR